MHLQSDCYADRSEGSRVSPLSVAADALKKLYESNRDRLTREIAALDTTIKGMECATRTI